MGQHTAIQWADSTLNLMIGCDGCELWNPNMGVNICYAGNLVNRYGGKNKGYPESFDKPKLFLDRLKEAEKWKDLTGAERPDKPWLNGLPRLIFLDDLGDTFTESLPIDWLAPLLPRMAVLPHIIILLTKRANRMLEFSKFFPFPKNFWLLVSVTSAANYNRIEQLMQVKGGSVKGISYEPAWGPIDVTPWLPRRLALSEIPGSALNDGATEGWTDGLRWIVMGGQSGTDAVPFDIAWPDSIIEQCRPSGTAVFLKQMGRAPCYSDRLHGLGFDSGTLEKRPSDDRFFPILNDSHGGEWMAWPERFRVREFPR